MNAIIKLLEEHQQVMSQLTDLVVPMEMAIQRIHHALLSGGKVLFMGNGGSAADSQHLAAELVGRFKAERRALAGIALSTDTSVLTALSNDYGYESIFARQIEALCRPQDVVFALSTSGNSQNILKGVKAAKHIGAYVIGLTGKSGGQLKDKVDLCFCVPSHTTSRIQEAHIFIGHTICEQVEMLFSVVLQERVVELNV